MRGDFMDEASRWEDLDKEMARRCEGNAASHCTLDLIVGHTYMRTATDKCPWSAVVGVFTGYDDNHFANFRMQNHHSFAVDPTMVDERMVHMPNNSVAEQGFRNTTRGAGNN